MNGYLTEYYDNTDSIDAATPVVIGDGTQITGIVLSPPLGGSITGRVVQDSGGTAISNASVVLYSSNWSSWNTFYTDSNGYYCITGLESGSYYLAAAGAGSSEYYDNASSRDSPTPVAAVRGRNTPDINFSLGSSPSVSGRVTRDYDGAGIPNITVEVYIVRDAKIYNRQSTATDASGYYSMTVYSAGGYYVKAVGNNDYFGELYNNATSEAQATMVNLVSGINTPNIIFSLATYGFISGRITNNSGGAAIPNATVTIYNENGNIYTQSSNASDATGYYRIRLSPGRYFIKAEDPLGAGVQYFDKADSLASARLIVLNSGQGIENINFSLFTSSVGSISGRVVIDTNGAGLQGAQVLAYSNSTNIYKSATTDASGYFKIAGLEPGQYYVRVSASGLTAVYISELFDNIPYNDSNSFSESVATQVEVKPGMDTPDINFGLSEYGSISGRVTRDSDGAPLPNMYVRLYKPNLSTIWQDVSTDSSGNYKLSNLAPGEYFIFVHSNKEYVDKFYNDASSLISATPIMVRSGLETANINFGLTVGGSISGRITRDSDGAGLPNINVLASSIDGTSYRNGHSDSAGYYKITGMSGSVTVRAESNSFYIGEYYKDSANAPTAATVTPGFDTGNINLSLATGGVISGHVTCDTSVSEIIYINVYDSSWNLLQSPAFSSNATISYVIQGLAPGGYYLKTHSLIGVCTDKYYNNTASQNEAALISVAQGVDTGNINFNLNLDAIISGRVVCDSDSAAISGVDIQVYDAGWSMIASARTGSSGDYRIPNLVPGKYYLKTSNSLGYIDEYYNNAVNQNSAFQVETTAGVETQNINFSLRSNGSILGRVTQDADGTPIRNVAVLAYDSKWSFVASTTTDALGDYVIARLPSGAYYLQASAPGGSGFRDEYYNNAASRNAATAVAVEPGSDATGVNFELASGGAISGRITRNSDGVGIASAKISVYKLNKELESTVLSDSSGYYIVAGLPAGSYYVQVSVGSAYIGEYYNNAPSITTATTVSVANGNDTGNINFGLAGEKSITGKVIRDKDGAPIPGVIVQAFSNFSSISRISSKA
jgi:protocatechuate 3,4-dioxygenase beta subunit